MKYMHFYNKSNLSKRLSQWLLYASLWSFLKSRMVKKLIFAENRYFHLLLSQMDAI